MLTFSRSVQQGIAAKMSYEYIVPRTSDEPSHFWAQNLKFENVEKRLNLHLFWIMSKNSCS